MRPLVLGALLIVLSACSYLPVAGTQNPAGTPSDRGEAPGLPDDTGGPPSGAATASAELLRQSRRSQEAGQYPQAASDIERALRIEPRNAYLWLELGRIRLATGDRQQAIALAQKAMSMSGNDPNARNEAQRLLDEAMARL